MKLSNETVAILKNFGAINQGILFKKGKTLKTVSSHKNILAEVDIKEDIPAEFGIYNLNEFLSVISLHKDDPSFEFDDKQVTIIGNKGRSKVKYRFTPANMIVTPPEKALAMPDAEIKFDLTSDLPIIKNVVDQAKEMEKEQIEDAWTDGMKSNQGINYSEQYYNKQFKETI
jgi:hypothetical protein